MAERGKRGSFTSPITAVQTVLPAGHKPPHKLVCLNVSVDIRARAQGTNRAIFCYPWYDLRPHFCMLVKPFSPCTSLPCLPLVISMMHGSRPSSEYLRWRLKLIPAVPPPAKGAQQAHHQVFYKQKLCPVVLFHRLTLNTPPLCALFVFNNALIQQQHYKSERHNKKRHNSYTFFGPSRYIYIVFMCFFPLHSSLSLALLWCFWPCRLPCQ